MTDYACFPAIERQVGRRVAPAARRVGGQRSALQGREVHSDPEVSCEHDNARWVNVVLSNLKRSLDGAYHAFKFAKYAQRYLAETMWRFNRRFDLAALVPRLLIAAARTGPWPEQALRDVPVFAAEGSC